MITDCLPLIIEKARIFQYNLAMYFLKELSGNQVRKNRKYSQQHPAGKCCPAHEFRSGDPEKLQKTTY